MTITLKKKPGAPAPVLNTEHAKAADGLASFAADIDELGDLMLEAAKVVAKIKALEVELKPYKDKLAEVQALVDDDTDSDEDAEPTYKGTRFEIKAGKKGSSRKITDMKLVRKLLKDDVFFQCATVTLGDLDKYLTEADRKKVTETTRGKRTIKVELRGGLKKKA